ncbi:MAG: hypothetical protein HY719_01425 [Planctomycetes bacterium]|nr:hypothetical protein [Planctomycetota bacterium]
MTGFQRRLLVFCALFLPWGGSVAAGAERRPFTNGAGNGNAGVRYDNTFVKDAQYRDHRHEKRELPGAVFFSDVLGEVDYGFADRFDAGFSMGMVQGSREFNRDAQSRITGVSDMTLGLRWQVVDTRPAPAPDPALAGAGGAGEGDPLERPAGGFGVMLKSGVKLPGIYNPNQINSPGDGQADGWIGPMLGATIPFDNLKPAMENALDLMAGLSYKARNQAPPNETDLEVGLAYTLGAPDFTPVRARLSLFWDHNWTENGATFANAVAGVNPLTGHPARFPRVAEERDRATFGFTLFGDVYTFRVAHVRDLFGRDAFMVRGWSFEAAFRF